MNLNLLFFLFINFWTTFTCFASTIPSADSLKGLSDAELALIGLSPPNDRPLRTQANDVSPVLNPQESLTSSFITYDTSEEEQPIASEKPFTITFPISRSSGNKQSVQSIVIPLPSNLDDKTGIIVIEDHDDGGNLDRRTLRAQFFSPTRIKPFRSQPLREENVRNESESSLNRIITSNKRSQTSNNRIPKKASIETKAEPSTTSSVVFDDDVLTVTSTFSPESVFRPKPNISANNKKQNLTTVSKPIHPIIDTMTISLKARQRISKKSKSVPKTPKTTTTTTTTTTETPTTTEFEEEEDIDNIENTESTTFATPETTTRTHILKQLASVNERPNIRQKWNQFPIITTQRTTTQRPTTQRPTTTTTEMATTLRTTTQSPTTERIETTTTQRPRQRTVPKRRTQQRRRQSTTTTTTTPSPTTTTITSRLWDTTTSAPFETTEVDYELIAIDNSTERDFNRNSLKLIKPKNRTKLSDEEIVLKPRPPSAPKIPGNSLSGFLPSGKAFNLPHNVPGSPGVDYPTYDKMPATGFDCKEQMYPGFYADMDTGCQVYHSCNGNLRGSKHTFLCPNGTIFSQEYLICDWWYNVNCNDSPIYYPLNKEAFSSPNKSNSTKIKGNNNTNNKKKPKTTTTEFVIRTITTTDLP